MKYEETRQFIFGKRYSKRYIAIDINLDVAPTDDDKALIEEAIENLSFVIAHQEDLEADAKSAVTGQ